MEIQSNDAGHDLLELCQKFILEDDEGSGKEALKYIRSSHAQISGDVAQKCFEAIIEREITRETETQDRITSELLHHCLAARVVLGKRFQEGATLTFKTVYRIGDGSANAVAAVVMDPSAWATETIRQTCEKDVFQLFLAKLMEIGQDYDDRSLKGISKLLATDANSLESLVDQSTFDTILTCLDNRLPVAVRSQATLATAKFLEASQDRGRNMLSEYITTRVGKRADESLILAFSAAASIFPLVPSVASALFLTEGFIQSLVPLLERKTTSWRVEQAALDMLSAACLDTACREAVSKHCTTWLEQVIKTGKGQIPGLAAVILTKVQAPGGQATGEANGEESGIREEGSTSIDELVPMFRRMMDEKEETHQQSSIEGLAYASVQPKVKETLANDRKFLEHLMQLLKNGPATSPIVFGGLTIFENLTRYQPTLSEEQKRLFQLKAYANASKTPLKSDPLDEDIAVTKRCKIILDAGVISLLVGIFKSLNPTSLAIIFSTLLSLSRTPAYRGTIAQQGGVKLLLQAYPSINGSTAIDLQSRHTTAHALARILISVDPTLVFSSSGSPPLTSAIRPLLTLLTDDSSQYTDGPRNLLPAFEALLALTNLASTPSPEAANTIIHLAFPTLEELLLSNNTMLQRATTELLCNLTAFPSGIEIFSDGSKAAARRLHILLALADVEDEATRRAAGGALAATTEFEGTVTAVLARDRGVEILLGLCEDGDQGIVHRGVVCIRNLTSMDDETGKQACDKIKELGGVIILEDVLRAESEDAVAECAVEALKALAG